MTLLPPPKKNNEMTVTYTVPSSYTISIPSSITVGKSAIVSASKVVLDEGDTLSVSASSKQYANNSWQLVNSGKSIPYTIKNGEQSLSNNATVLTAQSGETPSVTLSTALAGTTEPLSYAGDYTDTLVFAVEAGPVIDLSKLKETYVIKDSKTYTFTGSGNWGINVKNGEPTIKLVNANITSRALSPIYVERCNATVHVIGECQVESKGSDAGILVTQGTLTIKGDSSADQLTAKGRGGGGGICAACTSTTDGTGNIEIKNVTVSAYGSSDGGSCSPGIGAPGNQICGTITIDGASVSAYGAGYSSAIGGGIGANGYSGQFGMITIKNHSTVSVKKEHDPSNYIGKSRLTGGMYPVNGIEATIEDGSQVIILKE